MKELVASIAKLLKANYPSFDIIVDDLKEDFQKAIKLIVYTQSKLLVDNRYQVDTLVLIDIYSEDILECMGMSDDLKMLLEFLPHKGLILKGYNYTFKAEGLGSSKKTFNSKQAKFTVCNASINYSWIEYREKDKVPTMQELKKKVGMNG